MMSNLIVYAQLALVAGEAKKADGSCPDWPATYTDSTAGASCVCFLFGGKHACKDGDTCGLDDNATHGGGADDEACVPLCTVLTSADIGPSRNRWCKDSDGQMCWTEYAVASPGKKCPPMCPRGPGKATANCVCETVQDANGKYWAGAKFQCRAGDTCLTSEKLTTRDEVCKPGPRSRATGSTPADPRSPAGATNTGTIIGVSVAVVVVVLGIGAGVYWWFTRGRPSTKHKDAKQSLSRRGVKSRNGKKTKN